MSEENIDRIVLCAASSYTKKYFLNPLFSGLPDLVQRELQITAVVFTERVGGIITFFFNTNGNLLIETGAADFDAAYDEIGADLEVKSLRTEKAELLESIETYFKVVALHQPLPGDI